VLATGRFTAAVDAPPAALYLMVAAHGRLAKIGALESAANAADRLRTVERHQRIRDGDSSAYPLRVVVVGEIPGLVLDPYRWTDYRWDYELGKEAFDQRWAEVEHLESAVRLSLSRRVRRLAWTDWIEVARPPETDEAWLSAFLAAWREADELGSPPQPVT